MDRKMTKDEARAAIPWAEFELSMTIIKKRVNTVEILELELKRMFLMNAGELDPDCGDSVRTGLRCRARGGPGESVGGDGCMSEAAT